MGNSHSSAFVSRTVGALDAYVAELGADVIYDKSLGASRFLKTVKCRHRHGYLVVKIFVKPDPNVLEEKYLTRLRKEQKSLQDVPNAYTYQAFLETDKAGYLVRQWVASSLYDRISTRPFLSLIEKKWISYQILSALRDARKHKVSHGDIKSENILVTSWNWVYVTDFASFKPTFLPLDNPSDFAYFYDTSGRRNCYIAPERFYTTEKTPEQSFKRSGEDSVGGRADGGKKESKVTEAMDVFGVGCVLAELFLEGAALFTLSQLFKYRTGELDVDLHLAPIEDKPMRDLIKRMIALEPEDRPTFDTILHSARGMIFPDCFYSPLYDFVSSVNELSSPSPFTAVHTSSTGSSVPSTPMLSSADDKNSFTDGRARDLNALPADSDRRLLRVWAEYDTLESVILTDSKDMATTVKIDYAAAYSSSKPLQSLTPVVLHLAHASSRVAGQSSAPAEDGPALVVLSLVCANIRNCSLPNTKIRAFDLLLALSVNLTDEAKLDRLLPYVIELLHDEAPTVRAAALRTALQVLTSVNAITPFNAEVFPRFLLTSLRQATVDSDVAVRCVAAQSIVLFATLAVKYLEMGHALRAHGALKLSHDADHYDETQFEVSYDASLEELQNLIAELLSTLLIDSTSIVKRSVLLDIAPLCIFFGRQKTNDVLLSHMITYLNDRDWVLRYAFFHSIVDVAACLGGRDLEEYIFPLMTQALSDAEESNVAKVLSSLTTLSELGLFQKMRLWELMSTTLPLLYHPNLWIRQGAASFIASAAKQLPHTDVWCILYPSLKHYLRSELRVVDVRSILLSLKGPLPRHIYDFALDWAMRHPSSQFWRFPRKVASKPETAKDVVGSIRKTGNGSVRTVTRSEEDDMQLQKLQQLGMSSLEESKLVALKDYIAKSANSINSLRSRQKSESESDSVQTIGTVELQRLGVVPETIFIGVLTAQPNVSDQSRRISVNDGRVISRMTSFEQNPSGAPFEDLRRRLATINGSNTSLNLTATGPRGRIVSGASSALRQSSQALESNMPQSAPQRPGSPTESVVSTTNSVSFKPRFSVGSIESQKAAPAVGSVRTNAVGLLEAPGRACMDASPDRAGGSQASIAHTLRGVRDQIIPYVHDEGQEAALNRLLDGLYSSATRDGQVDFGPHIHEGPVRRRNPTRQNFTLRDTSKRRTLESSLITHLNAHTNSINGIAVSPDHMFFLSCSDDKTVKIWDTARLERNVTSKARHTYRQHHASVKCICILENSHCFASAAEDGSVHVVRVFVSQTTSLPKYSKLQVIREHHVERPGDYVTFMVHYNTDDSSNLMYATLCSSIVTLDLKTMRVTQRLENPRHLGPIACICLDRKRTWMVTVTQTGYMTLWDLRFGLLLRSWRVGSSLQKRQPILVRQCVMHPNKGRGRWIMIALDNTNAAVDDADDVIMEVWDVESASLVECYLSSSSSSTSSGLELGRHELQPSETSLAGAIAELVTSRLQPPSSPNSRAPVDSDVGGDVSTPFAQEACTITALTAGSDFGGYSTGNARSFVDLASDKPAHRLHAGKAGYLLMGMSDCSIKLWDLEKFERSTILVVDEDAESEKPSYSSRVSVDQIALHIESRAADAGAANVAGGTQRSGHVHSHQKHLLRAHQDCITSVACVDSPFRGSFVSGDRSGVIKVWRVEGLELVSSSLYS